MHHIANSSVESTARCQRTSASYRRRLICVCVCGLMCVSTCLYKYKLSALYSSGLPSRAGGTLFHDPHKARPLTPLTSCTHVRAAGPLQGTLYGGPRVPLHQSARHPSIGPPREMAPNSYYLQGSSWWYPKEIRDSRYLVRS